MFLKKHEIDLYLDMAFRVSEQSNIAKAKVGCLNLYASGAITIGWNHMPDRITGFGTNDERLHSVHAETAASSVAWKHGIIVKNHYKFITHEPCLACAKQAHAEGATAVIFEVPYGVKDGVRYLYSHGIDVILRKRNGKRPTTYYELSLWYQDMPSDMEWIAELEMYAIPLFRDDVE